ncbi:2-dehydropantoate 2-reductase [Limosilactobacillus ingluviei]
MRIAVAGVGGMGTRFALKLAQAGNDITLVETWSARLAALKTQGLQAKLDGQEVTMQLPAYAPDEVPATPGFDLILFLTKSMQLAALARTLQPLYGPQTYVLCLMNGIGHEQTLGKYVPQERLLLGNTMWTAQMARPDHVLLQDDGSCELGSLTADPTQVQMAKTVVEVFRQAGLKPRLLDDPRYSVFRKGCVNGTLNTLCTLLECNVAEFGQTTPAHALVEACYTVIGEHYPSMYQDLVVNNRPTEIDYINGYVARHGQAAGVATPYCQLLTAQVHVKEQLRHAHNDQ